MSMTRESLSDSNRQLISLGTTRSSHAQVSLSKILPVPSWMIIFTLQRQNRSDYRDSRFMIMETKNYLQIGRKCEVCTHTMVAEKATKHRSQRYDIYWVCKECKFAIRELDRSIREY